MTRGRQEDEEVLVSARIRLLPDPRVPDDDAGGDAKKDDRRDSDDRWLEERPPAREH
jgi:hypothetical protein